MKVLFHFKHDEQTSNCLCSLKRLLIKLQQGDKESQQSARTGKKVVPFHSCERKACEDLAYCLLPAKQHLFGFENKTIWTHWQTSMMCVFQRRAMIEHGSYAVKLNVFLLWRQTILATKLLLWTHLIYFSTYEFERWLNF